MVNLSVIEAQLTKLGVKKTFFCKPEIRELQHILMDNEDIIKCVPGRYGGGFALLVATEMRLLLIDKKPLYLTVEDVRYDMISEMDASSRLFDATVKIFTVNRQLVFNSTRQHRLRDLISYVQRRVMEIRQYSQEVSPAVQAARANVPASQSEQHSFAGDFAHQFGSHIPHMPRPHIPEPISNVWSHSRDYIPADLSQSIGSTATRLSARIHRPHPYTNGSLLIRTRWSGWSEP